MNFIDPYIFHFVVLSPLAAAIFITLVPTVDMGSKLAISRFFAFAGFLGFIRLFFLFLNFETPTQTSLSFNIVNFHITFTLILTKYNIFLYGAAAASLTVNMLSHVITDTKSNIHQVAPFLLTFFLYICFGQSDLRVALPVLSIANFLIYYLIGYADKPRRGSTIFQMGIFLFSCDAMVLVLLQIPYSVNLSTTSLALLNTLLLVPGLARLCLPMFAPFMKRLLLNVDEEEGPFLITFLQLSGMFILILVRTDLIEISDVLTAIFACFVLIGAIFVALLSIWDRNIKITPYYFLVFYSSLASTFLFLNYSSALWYFSISLFLTNIACFFHATRCALYVLSYKHQEIYSPQLRAIWFITLALFIGIPGFGIGASLWALFFWFTKLDQLSFTNPLIGFWIVIAIIWLIGLLLLSFALMLSIREDAPKRALLEIMLPHKVPALRSLLFGTFFVAVLSWIIPLTTLFAATKGP